MLAGDSFIQGGQPCHRGKSIARNDHHPLTLAAAVLALFALSCPPPAGRGGVHFLVISLAAYGVVGRCAPGVYIV